MIHGIDVSSYQPNDYDTAGLDFVFIKATEGTSYVNPKLEGQVHTARKHGLVVGFYHFQHHGNTQAQVDFFTKTITPHKAEGDIIALDWEAESLTSSDKDAWLKAAKHAHPTHKVILYTYTTMWNTADSEFMQDGLWIADPNHPAGHPAIKGSWAFQQYSSSGGKLDLNVGNFGTRDALHAWARQDAGPKVPKPTPVYAPFPGASFFRLGRKSPVITAMGKRLVAEGYKGYKVGPGPEFSRADLKAYAWWQRELGYSGSSADGYPGPASWAKLRVPKS